MTMNAPESDFQSLNSQLAEDRNAVPEQKTDEVHVPPSSENSKEMGRGSKEKRTKDNSRKIVFKKGDKVFEIDEDAEIEFKADKEIRKLKASELRDKAAGDVAIQNRMKDLAEKRKEAEAFAKGFSSMSKADPMKALKYAIDYVQKSDPEINFDSFLKSLSDQASSLSKMSESELKAWKLERDIRDKETQLKQYDLEKNLNKMKDDLISEIDITSEQFDEMAISLLEHEELAQLIEKEDDLIEAVSLLHYEMETIGASYDVLKRVDPSIKGDDQAVFALSDIIKENPDFDEKDIEDIVYAMFKEARKEQQSQTQKNKQKPASDERKNENLSDYEFLMRELLSDKKKKQTISK